MFLLEDLPKKIKSLTALKTFFSFEQHPLGDLWEMLFLPFYLYYKKADIFHSLTFHIPLFTFKTKKIVTIHDMIIFKCPETFSLFFRVYAKILTWLSIKRSDAIIVPSLNTKKDIVNLFPKEENKIFVIPIAASEAFQPIEDNNIFNKIRSKYNLPESFILSVGAIEPRKNLYRLIQAYNKIKKNSGIKQKLVICGGKGWLGEFEKLDILIKELGLTEYVIFTGYVADKDQPAIYNMADLFVYPSLYEGFGLPPLEAMASGCPVITSNTSSIPEVTAKSAILIDPVRIEEISDAIVNVLEKKSLWLTLRKNGLKRASVFSWKKTATEVLGVYNSFGSGSTG